MCVVRAPRHRNLDLCYYFVHIVQPELFKCETDTLGRPLKKHNYRKHDFVKHSIENTGVETVYKQ